MVSETSSVSIVMPAYNSLSTIERSISSLEQQSAPIERLILVIDGGSEAEQIASALRDRTFLFSDVVMIRHGSNRGLAAAYNSGIKLVESSITLFCHSDVYLDSPHAVAKMLEAMQEGKWIAAGHLNPPVDRGVGKSLSVPAALLLCASNYKKAVGWNGQFDAVMTGVLRDIGGFDSDRFGCAGEDGDLLARLSPIGEIGAVNVAAHHIDSDHQISFARLYKKRFQYAEAHGALLSLYGFSAGSIPGMLWRPTAALCILLSLPLMAMVSGFVGAPLLVTGIGLSVPVAWAASRLRGRWLDFPFALSIDASTSCWALAGFVLGLMRRRAHSLPEGRTRKPTFQSCDVTWLRRREEGL